MIENAPSRMRTLKPSKIGLSVEFCLFCPSKLRILWFYSNQDKLDGD